MRETEDRVMYTTAAVVGVGGLIVGVVAPELFRGMEKVPVELLNDHVLRGTLGVAAGGMSFLTGIAVGADLSKAGWFKRVLGLPQDRDII